jgi:paraquat-inducible protein A
MSWVSAADLGLALCEVCGRLEKNAEHARCPRCHARLHQRKPHSIERAWALLLAAFVLYLPANLLPIMETRSLFGVQRDTILSGVAYLWSSGSWVLAIIVFVASVAVPLLKLLSLSLILLSVQYGRKRQPLQSARLYRLLELIGRWSMLDVYVVAVLVALVQAQSLATMAPGPGVLAFGAVVVLSMLATMAFDPRMIWDAESAHQSVETPCEPKPTAPI